MYAVAVQQRLGDAAFLSGVEMFVGNPQAGDRFAILHTILKSCQRLGINVAEYLTEVLSIDTRVADNDQLPALTPARWKKARSN